VRSGTPETFDDSVSQSLAALERASATADACSLQHLLGSLERLKAIIWPRLFLLTSPSERPRAEPLDDLRHVTPIQVAELLGVKEAYVHELCRSHRIPAFKEGKYWMIPVSELREWLARSRQGVDPRRAVSLPLPDWPAPAVPSSTGRPLRRRKPEREADRRL
jgi:excisionase family DNA binding protein